MEYSQLLKDLKKKKELKDLDDNFILKRIKDYLRENSIPDNKKSKEYKKIFKDLRRILRRVYGVFRVIKEKRNLEFYKFIFNKYKAKKILDLGCGLDPLYYAKGFNLEFYAADISGDIIKKINNYFKKNNVEGNAFVFNLADEDLDKLPEADICLMLKLLESLELVKKNISRELLKKIKTRHFVVSFSKIALGNKIKIRKSGRSWFRRILKELNYKYEILDYDNEIVFLITK